MFASLIPIADQGILTYVLIFLAALIEGPLTLLVSGAAIANGLINPLFAYLAVISGNTLADMGWYGLGRLVNMEWLLRFGIKLKIDVKKVALVREDIEHFAPRLLFLSKLTVGFPIPTLIATGLSRVPVWRWFGALLLGELIKSAVFLGVGVLYAEMIHEASMGIRRILWMITGIIFIIGMIVYRRYLKKREGIAEDK
jgi:membrane protein DedA with SNARE-associated domain